MKHLREIDERFQYLGIKVGGFLMVLVLLLLLMLGLLGLRQDFFVPTVTLYVNPERAEGILPGADVSLHGIRIGRVGAISLNEDGVPSMKLHVRKSAMPWLRSDTVARLSGMDLFGTPFIDLFPGDRSAPLLREESTLPFEREPSMGEIVANLELQLRPVIEQTHKLIAELNAPDGDVHVSLENLRKISTNLSEEVPVILRDARLSTEVSLRFLEDLAAEEGDLLTSAASLRKVTGEVEDQIPGLLQNVKESAVSLQQATARLDQLIARSSPDAEILVKKSLEVSEKADDFLDSLRRIWFVKLFLPKNLPDPEPDR